MSLCIMISFLCLGRSSNACPVGCANRIPGDFPEESDHNTIRRASLYAETCFFVLAGWWRRVGASLSVSFLFFVCLFARRPRPLPNRRRCLTVSVHAPGVASGLRQPPGVKHMDRFGCSHVWPVAFRQGEGTRGGGTSDVSPPCLPPLTSATRKTRIKQRKQK